MAIVNGDRVREYSESKGPGNINLGANVAARSITVQGINRSRKDITDGLNVSSGSGGVLDAPASGPGRARSARHTAAIPRRMHCDSTQSRRVPREVRGAGEPPRSRELRRPRFQFIK